MRIIVKTKPKEAYKGQNLFKFVLLPAAACLTAALAIGFMLSLLAGNNSLAAPKETTRWSEDESRAEVTSEQQQEETSDTAETSIRVEESTVYPPEDYVSPGQAGVLSRSYLLTYPAQIDVETYHGLSDPRTLNTYNVENPDDIAVLVNKYYVLPETYEPEVIPVTNADWFSLRPEANAAWQKMQQAYRTETGKEINLNSAYRSYQVQDMLFAKALKRKGIAGCVGYNALPGRSEHQLGLAIDIHSTPGTKNSPSFAETTAYEWLQINCSRFGFILRYPKHKTHITDYAFEPWHYRYVGADLAQYLTTNDLTLEEYYGLGPTADQYMPDNDNTTVNPWSNLAD
jgi:D-alanyl-D-alanine carboxypeptidase